MLQAQKILGINAPADVKFTKQTELGTPKMYSSEVYYTNLLFEMPSNSLVTSAVSISIADWSKSQSVSWLHEYPWLHRN